MSILLLTATILIKKCLTCIYSVYPGPNGRGRFLGKLRILYYAQRIKRCLISEFPTGWLKCNACM